MLHWLAGQKPPEGPTDPDATGYVEPPETPAPVFAVRAFKHAIFGTPQTTQAKPRRNSATDNGRPRNGDHRALRPGINRPMSANHAQTLAKQQASEVVEPMSPTKGILLTPGTAAAKKKNVTFGEHVIDNEGKRPSKSGLSEDLPGMFPETEIALADDSDPDEDGFDRRRSRTKLTEALEEAREESKKRKSKTEKRTKKLLEDNLDVPAEFVDPKTESGKYWKREYDAYRTNTQREVKKLITKQRAAKNFAQAKDTQCTDLADELRQEKKKVEKLEARMEELSTLMKDVSEQLLASRKEAEDRADELSMLKRQMGRKDSVRPESGDFGALLPLERTASGQQVSKETIRTEPDPVQRPSEPYRPSKEPEKPRMDLQTLRARVKTKPESVAPKPNDDIWAQSLGSSSFATRSIERPTTSPRTLSSTGAALQALDINTLGNTGQPTRSTSPKRLANERHSQLDHDAAQSKSEVQAKHIEKDASRSSVQPPGLPHPDTVIQPPSGTDPEKVHERHDVIEDKHDKDTSIPFQSSSQFDTDDKPPPPPKHGTTPGGSHSASTARRAQVNTNTKENVSPPSFSQPSVPPAEGRVQPSVMWSSINAPQPIKKITVVSKNGREVSADRLEAARARINARGRVAS